MSMNFEGDNKGLQPQIFQGEVSPDRYEIQGVYRTGAHSVIYRAKDKETGRTVAIKKHEHYLPQEGGDAKEIRDAEDRFRREAQILAKLNHPGIVDAYGFYFKEDDFKRKPFLVTELIERDSLEEMLGQGKNFNEQDARQVVLSVGTPIHYLHTANGRPIIHRDLKPDNVKVMPEDARWPHKIVDFSESKIGKATMSGSVTGTIGYNAPEIYGGGIADQSIDFYSLMRIAAHMLIGDNQKFMQTWLGNTSLREMKEDGDLNISEQFLQAIERATSRDQSHRYKTLAELAHDLGYDLRRIPETREELEGILGHKSLPVRIEPERQHVIEIPDYPPVTLNSMNTNGSNSVQIGSSNLPRVIDNPEEFSIGGIIFKNGNSVYETFRNIAGYIGVKLTEIDVEFYKKRMRQLGGTDDGSYERMAGIDFNSLKEEETLLEKIPLAYLHHIAPQYPVLEEALVGGGRSLEDVVKEKKPSKLMTLFAHLAEHIDEDITMNYPDEQERAEYVARRVQLYEILGGAFNLVHSKDDGEIIGKNLKHYSNRKLKKKAREVDSWIREGRRAMGLEGKFESVEIITEEDLTKWDKSKIIIKSALHYLAIGSSPQLIGGLSGNNELSALGGVLSLTFYVSGLFKKQRLLDKIGNYFTKKTLDRKNRETYLAAGLDEDGMREYEPLTIPKEKEVNLIHTLVGEHHLNRGLIKTRRFIGKGIEIRYKPREIGNHFEHQIGDWVKDYNLDIKIKVAPGQEKRAQEIIEALRPLALPNPQHQRISGRDIPYEEIDMSTPGRRIK